MRTAERHERFTLLLGVVMSLQLLVVNYWPGFPSPNERAHLYQAVAVASRGSLAIDEELRRFGPMEDVATDGRRMFPNKAPGLLPLLLPAALVARAIAPTGSPELLRTATVLGRLLAASLPFLLTVLLLARIVLPAFPRGGPWALAVFALATPALATGLLLFSHALTGFLLLVAWRLLFDREVTKGRAAGAGLLLGWAVTAEYPVAVPAVLLVASGVARLRIRGLAWLTLGGAPPALLLGLYNRACFGSPLALSAAHEATPQFAALNRAGFFGIGVPTLHGLAGLLLSPARGLLVFVPAALLAVAGAWRWRTLPLRPAASTALLAAPFGLLVLFSGYPNWHGGWFIGPRYLLPVLPLLWPLVAAGADRLLAARFGFATAAVLAWWGFLSLWPLALSFPFPPEDFPVPAGSLGIPLLRAGILVPTAVPGWVGVALLAVVIAAALVTLARCLPAAGALPRLATLALATALALAMAVMPAPTTWKAALEAAVIHDVYASGRPGALEVLLARADSRQAAVVRTWIERRTMITARSDPDREGRSR